ncbi:MAG: PmbA/TldA family metallopeptidase, partial [Candidatus Thorarchaeota archaeon]
MKKEEIPDLKPYLKLAEKEGADEVELYALIRKEKIVSIESNALKTATAGYQQGIGIRVLVNKSLGFTAVNSFEKE